MNQLTIEQALDLLAAGEPVVIPTETVYGLAANIFIDQAIEKVYALKQRPFHNPLIVHIGRMEDLDIVAREIPPIARRLAEKFWPGPLTLVLPKQPGISNKITAGGDSVAVRMPKHPVALALLQLANFPLAAPSANPFNYLSPTTSDDVRRIFPQLQDRILEGGPCQSGIESTVLGFDAGKVYLYRHGAISKEELEFFLGEEIGVKNKETKQLTSPGMLAKHYSPHTPLYTGSNITLMIDEQLSKHQKIGILSFSKAYINPNIAKNIVLSPTGNLEEAAQGFFAALHRLDELGLDLILAELFPEQGIGAALNDRLKRAAAP